jgi:hypothetical protein
MNKKIILISVLLIISSLFLLGCTNPGYCGDGFCSSTENQYTCSADCGVPSEKEINLQDYAYYSEEYAQTINSKVFDGTTCEGQTVSSVLESMSKINNNHLIFMGGTNTNYCGVDKVGVVKHTGSGPNVCNQELVGDINFQVYVTSEEFVGTRDWKINCEDTTNQKIDLFGDGFYISDIQEIIPKHSYDVFVEPERSLTISRLLSSGEATGVVETNLKSGSIIGQGLFPSEGELILEDFFNDGTKRCSPSNYSAKVGITDMDSNVFRSYEVEAGEIISSGIPFRLEVESFGFNLSRNEASISLRLSDMNYGFELDINESYDIVGYNSTHRVRFDDMLVSECINYVSGKYSYAPKGEITPENLKWVAYVGETNDLSEEFSIQEDFVKISVGESISVEGAGNYEGKKLTLELNDLVQTGSGTGNNTYETKWALKDGDTTIKIVQKSPPFNLAVEFGSNYMISQTIVRDAAYLETANEYLALIEEDNFVIEDTPTDEESSRAAWRSAEPFAIIAWSKIDDRLTMSVENNSNEILTLNQINVGGLTQVILVDDSNPMYPGEIKVVTFEEPMGWCNNQKFVFPKEEIDLMYDSSNIDGKIQYGVADLSVTCD